MTPEELHRDLTKAFNWPHIKLKEYPFSYPRGGGENRKFMGRGLGKEEGQHEVFEQMRNSVTRFVKGLKKIDKPRDADGNVFVDLSIPQTTQTGYYFQTEYTAGGRCSMVSYYNKDTKVITICNMAPASSSMGEYFFFNKYPAKNLMLGETPPTTSLGDYYSPILPQSSPIINWTTSNPFEVKP